jgi:2,4-dienoyl-CoA reductase-like NADH-dependent reductase (Old Yellow Enzyme family)
MRPEIVPELRRLTEAIHNLGAKASIQLGHCGNMTHRATCGQTPIGASTGFNLYSPTFVRAMSEAEILQTVDDFGNAVNLARQAGFDCVEIHAGHGYLISQFLSPYTNRRHDRWGGSLDNRMRFMRLVIEKVMHDAGNDMAVVVKINMFDGFRRGMQEPECLLVAQELERLGVHALVLSAGFVSKAPMQVMRGAMPLKTLAHYMDMRRFWWLKAGLALAGRLMIPTVPYSDAYFLETAKRFRSVLSMPLIYVGGITDRNHMEQVLQSGFVAFQMARALICDTDFVNKIQQGECTRSLCCHSNYCIGRMYTLDMRCHSCVDNLPRKIQREISAAEHLNSTH